MQTAAQQLGQLPAHEGFRMRGLQMTRIETFTDAAFAFSLTLLVIAIDLASSYAEPTAALQGVPAFAFSAVLLAIVLPVTWVGIPGWAYALLSIVMPIFAIRTGRRRRKLRADYSSHASNT
ncbi:MAG: hypothetical protein VYE73_03355 [Acidobacteriota bacterium]|nr:hypothetical protein [Acidobacteriota bacterium]